MNATIDATETGVQAMNVTDSYVIERARAFDLLAIKASFATWILIDPQTRDIIYCDANEYRDANDIASEQLETMHWDRVDRLNDERCKRDTHFLLCENVVRCMSYDVFVWGSHRRNSDSGDFAFTVYKLARQAWRANGLASWDVADELADDATLRIHDWWLMLRDMSR